MQPYINYIENYDAKLPYTIEYKYLGAERVITNEISIRENVKNGKVIYTAKSTKFDKNHIVPANKLSNGTSYAAKLRVQLASDEWSEWSPEMTFTCLATPILEFQSLDDKNYIYNNDVEMVVVYKQEQGEKIDTYQMSLLNENKVPITTYPTRMPEETSPNVLTERMSDLVKGRLYYIGCRVTTKNGINFFDTHEFIPHYIAPSFTGIINVQNQNDGGQVMVQTFLKQMLGTQTTPFIDGEEGKEDLANVYSYVDNEWVVIPKNKPLMYQRLGMAKASDWIAKIWCKNVQNGLFLRFTRTNGEPIEIRFYKHDNYITCEKEYLDIKSRTISNIVSGLKLNEFYLYIKVIEYRVQMTIIPKFEYATYENVSYDSESVYE